MKSAARYPIRAVSKLTGIPIDTLRAWERRYHAVTPSRDARGRVYSDADVTRLRLMNSVVLGGHAIGRVAGLSDAELRHLAGKGAERVGQPGVPLATAALDAALARLDGAALDQEFSRLAAVLPPIELVRDVLLPAIRRVGDRWHRESAGIAHEHLMSSTLRNLLGSLLRLHTNRDARVRLVFATPAGDRHEIGILGAAMLAASSGAGVSYLGPDLPAQQIVGAVAGAQVDVLVLGLTLKDPGRQCARELRAIVRELPAGIELWAGGPAAEQHAAILQPRALMLEDLDAYQRQVARVADARR